MACRTTTIDGKEREYPRKPDLDSINLMEVILDLEHRYTALWVLPVRERLKKNKKSRWEIPKQPGDRTIHRLAASEV